MKKARNTLLDPVTVGLAVLVVGLVVSVVLVFARTGNVREKIRERERRVRRGQQQQSFPVENMVIGNEPLVPELESAPRLFSGELRVAAIGSAYPIPYEAEVCPFSSIPQPAFNQLDRDGDGMTDDWEIRYEFDRHNPLDALADSDQDGFSNVEEFKEKTNPVDSKSHPPYARKLRFIGLKKELFPMVFQGASLLSDGSSVFQVNTPGNGRTYFLSLGERVQDITLKRFVKGDGAKGDRLIVFRGGSEVELPRGERVPDPESRAELINILDSSRVIATMGALLSVHNDEYTVVGVYRDKVVVRHVGTEKVFDIVGMVGEEKDELLRESE